MVKDSQKFHWIETFGENASFEPTDRKNFEIWVTLVDFRALRKLNTKGASKNFLHIQII